MKTKQLKTILLLSLISLPTLVLAQPVAPIVNPVTVTSIYDIVGILNTVVNWIFAILLIVAIIYILLAAFAYLSSAGDPEKVQGAQNRLIYAAVAIGIALIAKGIIFVVQNLMQSRIGY